MQAASAKPGTAERFVAVLVFAVLVCLRMPDILAHGRFWAEDGKVFFQNAWTMPWYRALLVPVAGYLDLPANLGGVLARYLVPLVVAPYVTCAVGLVFQLCPAVLLATARDPWLQGRRVLAGALLLALTTAASVEPWLSAIGSQCWLALSTALILVLDIRGGGIGVIRLTILLVAALSGPGAWALIPLFAVRSLADRSWDRAVQGLVLAIGAAVQLAFFFSMEPTRSYGFTVPLLLCIVYVKHLLLPLLGHGLAYRISLSLHAAFLAGRRPLLPIVVTVLAFGGLALTILRARARAALWLFVAGGALAVVAYYGALDGRENLLVADFGSRYAFAPTVLFDLSVLALACEAVGVIRIAASVLAIWMIVVGGLGFFHAPRLFSRGPNWAAEVALWRADPSRPLAIWPQGWIMQLAPRPQTSGSASD